MVYYTNLEVCGTILHYILIYGGNENAIIKNTMKDCCVSDITVMSAIRFLKKKGFIEYVDEQKLNDIERSFYSLGSCTLRRIGEKHFSEQELEKEQEIENSLDHICNSFENEYKDMFNYVTFGRTSYKKAYTITIDKNKILAIIQDNVKYILDLKETSNWYFDAYDNVLYFYKDSFRHYMQLVYHSEEVEFINPTNFIIPAF